MLATSVKGVAVNDAEMFGAADSPYTAYPPIAIGRYKPRMAGSY